MRSTLFRVAPARFPGTLLMLLGSVAMHGLVIAAAWLWPSSLAYPAPSLRLDLLPEFPSDAGQPDLLPASTPGFDDPLPPPLAPPVPVLADVDDTPPPAEDPDPTLPPVPSPLPPNHAQPAPRTASHPDHHLSSTAHASRATRGTGLPAGPGSGDFSGTSHPGSALTWKTTRPPYPYAMLSARVHGSGTLRVTTDPGGQVVMATVLQSSGSTILDDHTCRYARGSWSGPPSATRTISFTYQLP